MDVVGLEPDVFSQFTFIDYDPVTGNILRRAFRPMFFLRIERGPLLVNLIGSQRRCISPTKQYLQGFAFGCYAFIPIFWFEDARVIDPQYHFDFVTHFYERPSRVLSLSNIGIGFGVALIVCGVAFYLNDMYYRNRFLKRVYVD